MISLHCLSHRCASCQHTQSNVSYIFFSFTFLSKSTTGHFNFFFISLSPSLFPALTLLLQVAQLRELFDTQSKSKSKTIKELINDLAEERKKLSALQIEVDRLRKLNSA